MTGLRYLIELSKDHQLMWFQGMLKRGWGTIMFHSILYQMKFNNMQHFLSYCMNLEHHNMPQDEVDKWCNIAKEYDV